MLKLPYSELEADVKKTSEEMNKLIEELENYNKDKKEEDDLSFPTVDGNPLESETLNEKEIN